MVVAQKVASFLTLVRSIIISLLILALVLWNVRSINQSAVELLSLLPRIQQFEASGVKFVLTDDAKLRSSLTTLAERILPEEEKRETIEAVKRLSGAQIDRLFTIERDAVHCEYTKPTAKMRLYVNIDAELEQAQIVRTEPNAEALEKETSRVSKINSDIGSPRSCYSMVLTPLGYNAKSALIGVIRQALSN